MICILLFPIVIPIILCIVNGVDPDNIFYGCLMGTLIGCLLFLILTLTGAAIATVHPDLMEVYRVEETPLYALKDNTATSGSFFLGSRSIDSKLKYFYLIKDEQGRLSIKNINVEGAYLVELADGSSIEPHITHEYSHFKSWVLRLLFTDRDTTTTFYIPEGSIQYNFNIDLE